MKKLYLFATSALFGMYSLSATAGAGANVMACLMVKSSTNSQSKTINFTAGGSDNHCLNSKGKNSSIAIPPNYNGIVCNSVGYVEEKGSSSHGDTCSTDTSKWDLSFSDSTGAASGSAVISMERDSTHNAAKILSDGAGNATYQATLCGTQADCGNSSVTWNHKSQGPIYVIFKSK